MVKTTLRGEVNPDAQIGEGLWGPLTEKVSEKRIHERLIHGCGKLLVSWENLRFVSDSFFFYHISFLFLFWAQAVNKLSTEMSKTEILETVIFIPRVLQQFRNGNVLLEPGKNRIP